MALPLGGVAVAAAPVAAVAVGAATAGVLGLYATNMVYKEHYASRYKEDQQAQQAGDLALLGKDRGELFNAIQEGRLDDIQIPEDMSIRGMLNVAAMFIYSMRDGFPQSLEAKPGGQICKEMLLALGLDPGSPNCRAIVRASERTELSPDEQLAFIEGHLAKTISLDLYGRSPSIAPPPGEPYSEDSSEVSNEEVVQIEDSIRLDPPSLPVPDAAPIRSDTQA